MKLTRKEERNVKSMLAIINDYKSTIDKNNDRIAKIDEEFRLKAEAKKKELVEENKNASERQEKYINILMDLYEMTVDEAIAALADDDINIVVDDDTAIDEPECPTPDNDDVPEVVDEDEVADEAEPRDLDAEEDADWDNLQQAGIISEFDPQNMRPDNAEEIVEEQDMTEDDGFKDVDWDSYNNDGTLNFAFND